MATEDVAKLPAFSRRIPVRSCGRTCCRAIDMPLSRLASHLGVSRQTLYDIINEKRGLTADIAARLGRAFGNSALFWLNLQSQHDAWLAERSKAVRRITRIEHAGSGAR